MKLTPSDIIEAVVDELVLGDFADEVPEVPITRIDSGTLLLDFIIRALRVEGRSEPLTTSTTDEDE